MIDALARRISRLFSFLRPRVRAPLPILGGSFCPKALPPERLAVSADLTTLLISHEPIRLVDCQRDAASATLREGTAAGYAFPIGAYAEAFAGLRNKGAEEWTHVVEADRALTADVLGRLTGLDLPLSDGGPIILHTRITRRIIR